MRAGRIEPREIEIRARVQQANRRCGIYEQIWIHDWRISRRGWWCMGGTVKAARNLECFHVDVRSLRRWRRIKTAAGAT